MTDSESTSSEPEATAVGEGPPLRERQWAFATHLAALAGFLMPFGGNILGPLILWQFNKSEMPFVDDQGKQAVNFQITVAVAVVLGAVLAIEVVQLVVVPVIIVFGALILTIRGAIGARNGEAYRYPVTWGFIEFVQRNTGPRGPRPPSSRSGGSSSGR